MVASAVWRTLLLQFITILALTSGVCVRAAQQGYTGQLLLVSMDGFRWDYLNKANTPNFDRMIREGVRAPYVTAPFVTLTFPSHYTIVTGLYEESHGIINNYMYDPVFRQKFTFGTKDTKWWDGAEPIWINARKNNLTAGTFFWPGSMVKLQNMRANIWLPYDHDVPFRERVDTVVSWFADFRLNFVTLYFNEPDSTGHKFGPNSPEVLQKVEEMDEVLGYLLQQMEKSRLLDIVNIIVTSDHGMAETIQDNKTIELNNYVNSSMYSLNGWGPTAQINPRRGFEAEVYDLLTDAHTNMTVYWRRDIPERWHYTSHRRIPDILAVADEGWYIRKKKSTQRTNLGSHGYDNKIESMRPIFVARGPNFRENYKSQSFELVSVYPLMCKLLGIPPAPNNGSLGHVQGMLRQTPEVLSHASVAWPKAITHMCALLVYFVILHK